MSRQEEDTLVLLRVYSNAIDAHIARGVLQSNGVMCVLNDENMSSIYPMTPVGEVRLFVRNEDVFRAEELLTEAMNC